MVIHVLVVFAVIYRKTYRGKTNSLFLMLNVLAFVVALFDVINGAIKTPIPTSMAAVYVSYFFSSFYFVARNALTAIYFVFLVRYFRLSRLLRKPLFLALFYLPFFAALALMITNLFTGIIFTVDMTNGYQRHDAIMILYVLAFIYLIAGIVLLLFVRKTVSLSKWLSLLGLYALTILAIVLQYLDGTLMIELLVNAISFLIVTFTVLRPEELTEPNTGLASYRAFQLELTKALSSKEKDHIVFIRFANSNNLRSYFGKEIYIRFLKSIAFSIEKYCREKRINVDVYVKPVDTLIFLVRGDNVDPKAIFDVLLSSKEIFFPEIKTSFGSMDIFGCSLEVPNDCKDEKTILHLGDSFEYFMDGKSNFVLGTEILANKTFKIESNLGEIFRRAIENNRLSMVYQPIYDLKAKRFRSAEALVRLNDEEFGLISPSLFIPAAERQNLLKPISDFVLNEVYRFVGSAEFEELGLDYIEVNLSVLQCLDPGLVSQIKELEKKYRIDPKHINFEITESVYAQDSSIFDKNLISLCKEGYEISLDDYGTGYSNIHRLLSLPLSIIKIDKSMVDAAFTKEGSIVIANSIKMMKDVDKYVVVEGVESKEQVDIVESEGADFIQGFYFSKPLSEDDFVEFLAVKRVDYANRTALFA
ncbi:MAG: EAL domain-containing protein [Bacilli bacterium]|nr:EAL domain-containing protein [Bacilli bacterium]